MKSLMVVGGECGVLKKVCGCIVEVRVTFYLRLFLSGNQFGVRQNIGWGRYAL